MHIIALVIQHHRHQLRIIYCRFDSIISFYWKFDAATVRDKWKWIKAAMKKTHTHTRTPREREREGMKKTLRKEH